MKIVISCLFFYNPDLCREFMRRILPELDRHLQVTDDSVEFVITDNTPQAESILSELEQALMARQTNRLRFRLKLNDYNKGFGKSHNEAFDEGESDVFIALNNDIFFNGKEHSGEWLRKLCAPFVGDPLVAVVGVIESPRVINEFGEGRWLDLADQVPDYAEGSILAIRSEVAKRLGLFSPDLDIAYFEDSDLSLRYRQAGLKIDYVSVPHEHRRSASSKVLDADLLLSIRAKNKTRFMGRWKEYLRRRAFQNRIFLDFTSGGWGDVVAAIPVVTGLLRDHPTAQIELQTNQLGLKTIFSFPRVSVRTENFKSVWQAEESGDYDRIFSLSQVNYSSALHLGMQIALDAGVEFDAGFARESLISQIFPNGDAVQSFLNRREKYALAHLQSFRSGWEGRSPEVSVLVPMLNEVKNKGYTLVLIGNDNPPELRKLSDIDLSGSTSIQEIFSLAKSASLFVGIDSGPLHVAQLFNIPTYAIFGATLPSSKLLDPATSAGYQQSDLNCLGCYHRHVPSPRNYCIRRDEACVKKIDGESLRTSFVRFLEGQDKKAFIEHNAISLRSERYAMMAKQELNAKLPAPAYPDLSDARLRQLMIALYRKIKRMMFHKLGLHS